MALYKQFLDNPSKENFELLKKDGLALSIVFDINKDKLMPFIKNGQLATSFENWERIYKITKDGLKEFASQQMSNHITNYEQGIIVYNNSFSNLIKSLT